MQMADPYVRISKPTSSFAASRYVFVCTRHVHAHTHTQVSSCKTFETRLSFFLLQFRHVDLHGHANSIRHETPRGNGLGASGSRHKVTTDRFLVDYFKSKLRPISHSTFGLDVWEPTSALLFRRLTFFSPGRRVSGYFCTRISARSRRSQLPQRAVFRPETRSEHSFVITCFRQ